MDDTEIKYFVEAALLAAGQPLSVDQLQNLFDGGSEPEKSQIRQAISSLLEDYEDRGFTIKEVASGYRLQIDSDMVERLQRLWEQRPPRYSRAMFETLALIAYRQPMTRGEIEEIRGVAVSTNIIRSLLEREWVRVVGHRDVPGRPEMFGTTRQFLDYFGLKKLDDLPPLADLSDWESLRVQLNLPAVEEDGDAGELPEDGQPQTVDLAAMDIAAEEGNVDDAIEGQFDPEDSTAEDLPVLNTEEPAIVDVEDVAEIPDIETALSIDAGIEPIKATEWPDPVEGDTVVQTLDTDVADDEAAEHEDADASLTGA